MTSPQTVRQHQARIDLHICCRIRRLCRWIIRTTSDPTRRMWAQAEFDYYGERARSDIGLIRNP